MTARPARSADATRIAQIEVETWRASYAGILPDRSLLELSVAQRAKRWGADIRRNRGVWVWSTPPDGVIGFGFCGRHRGGATGYDGEVYMLYVAPDAQGRGIGAALLQAMRLDLIGIGCSNLLVWVLRGNPARFFYERMGGRLVLQQQIRFGGDTVPALAYGWDNLDLIRRGSIAAATRKQPPRKD